MAEQPKTVVVKCSVQSIGWREEYVSRLDDLVQKVNLLVTHTYQFARWIFVHELATNPDFPLKDWITEGFFVEVFLSLTTARTQDSRIVDKTRRYRELIYWHRNSYLESASFVQVELPNAQQIALYEATKMHTAYVNNVHLRFGQHLRRIVNSLLQVRRRCKELRKSMADESPDAIKSACEKTVLAPARQLKLAIARRKLDQASVHPGSRAILDLLAPILNAYRSDYQYKKGSIYYDAKASPEEHFQAFYRMAHFCESHGIRAFQCFPLRSAWTPCHFHIDTKILWLHILRLSMRIFTSKEDAWGRVVNLNSRAFKTSGSLAFRGSIQTDGVSVSVLKQNDAAVRQGRGRGRSTISSHLSADVQYIHRVPRPELTATTGRCVLIDPGRRDLLFCVHEASTREQRLVYRYTQNQKAKETRTTRFKRLLADLKNQHLGVTEAEDMLSRVARSSVDPMTYRQFLAVRHQVSHTLAAFYGSLPSAHSSGHPLFRKLRLSAHINQAQADDRLARNLRAKFGPDAVLVMGNWSAPRARYHEPIRGKGMREMLKKKGFQVYLVDEFNTSKHCPDCQQRSLGTFQQVPNPRPFRRKARPTVTCHGLLRCSNQNCLESVAMIRTETTAYRLWNRDMAAALNFRHILNGLRNEGVIPIRFQRRNDRGTDEERPAKRRRLR